MDTDLTAYIKNLAREKNAIILAHNYQPPEIQDLADMCGDSLELSRKAAATDADIIVFCGVHFMAETAHILSPEKTVLLPRMDAGCPMADMITPTALEERKKTLGSIPIITYVNSPASVKAMSFICCTSANAVQVAESFAHERIFMCPDRNLARYTATKANKQVAFWEGCCPIHNRLTQKAVLAAQKAHPGAVFLAHPECRPQVLDLADQVLSTAGILRFAQESDATEFIIGTEVGILHALKKANPDKSFFPAAENMICKDMKKITLQDVADCLENMAGKITLPPDIRTSALAAVQRMLDLG